MLLLFVIAIADCWGRKARIKDELGFGGFAHVLGFVFRVILLSDSFILGVVNLLNCLLFHDLFRELLISALRLVEVLTDYASLYRLIIAIHLQTNFQLCNEKYS